MRDSPNNLRVICTARDCSCIGLAAYGCSAKRLCEHDEFDVATTWARLPRERWVNAPPTTRQNSPRAQRCVRPFRFALKERVGTCLAWLTVFPKCEDATAGRKRYVERLNRRAVEEEARNCGVPLLPEEVDARCSHLRRGWYWGSQAFAERLMAGAKP